MIQLTAMELATSVRFNRVPRRGPLTLFAVMRNEMYFLPAFLSHYRSLGVEQFVIVDDASDDGTGDYLSRQPDCCSGMTHIRFGQRVGITDSSHDGLAGRAGPMLKRVVPEHYLRGQYVVVADADEFLLMPESVPTLADLIAAMKALGWKTVAASLIDFYPEALVDLEDATPPTTPEELFHRYGFFDAVPFVTLQAGRQPSKSGQTASERLFRLCGIREVPKILSGLPAPLARLLPYRPPPAAWFKTPIVLYDGSTHMVASHEANVTPPPEMLLAMAHFKFNGDSYRRIQTAIAIGAHARKGQKYKHYERMLQLMQQRGLSFIGPQSQRYHSPAQLLELGLAKLPSRLDGNSLRYSDGRGP